MRNLVPERGQDEFFFSLDLGIIMIAFLRCSDQVYLIRRALFGHPATVEKKSKCNFMLECVALNRRGEALPPKLIMGVYLYLTIHALFLSTINAYFPNFSEYLIIPFESALGVGLVFH